jgi:hypothetical protein
MNDIALAVNGGNTYVAAVGKHVHNNVFGDGGDAFLFQVA